MPASAINIPEGFEYVLISLLSTSFILTGQYVSVKRHSKHARVNVHENTEKTDGQQVQEQSKEITRFLNARDAHQNTLETLPHITIPALISGIRFPIFTAILVALWSVGRFAYGRQKSDSGQSKKGAKLIAKIGKGSAMILVVSAAFTAGSWVL